MRLANVIVAFSKPEDAKNIRNILAKNGFAVAGVCTSGAQAINCADELGSGILVCGGRFADMVYDELHDCLPPGVRMLLVASPGLWNGRAPEDVVCLGLPLKVHDLVSTLEMMMESLIVTAGKSAGGNHVTAGGFCIYAQNLWGSRTAWPV